MALAITQYKFMMRHFTEGLHYLCTNLTPHTDYFSLEQGKWSMLKMDDGKSLIKANTICTCSGNEIFKRTTQGRCYHTRAVQSMTSFHFHFSQGQSMRIITCHLLSRPPTVRLLCQHGLLIAFHLQHQN